MGKKQIAVFVVFILLLTAGLLWVRNPATQQVYPFGPSSGVEVGTYAEDDHEERSTGRVTIGADSALQFSYRLTTALEEPFAAVFLHKDHAADPFFDLSQMDVVSLYLSATQARRIPVYLTVDYEGFTSPDKSLSNLPLVKVIEYTGEGWYTIHKKELDIPSWWLRLHGLKKETFRIDFSRVNYIAISSCQTLGPGAEDTITLKELVFSHDNSRYYYLYALLVAGIFIGAGVVYMVRRKKVLVPYRAQQVAPKNAASKLGQITAFIAEQYANPELSVSDLHRALGISEREIGALIKRELGVSFKEYLNTVRLAEVKRLLLESELSIAEVAYKTGYNSTPHFNRVFKNALHMAPGEYREKHRRNGQ